MTTSPLHYAGQRLTHFGEDNQFTYMPPLQQHILCEQYVTTYNDMLTTKQPHHLAFSIGTISPLSHTTITTILHQLLSWAGLCPLHYASHSFRIGAAATATAVRLAPSLIEILGRWNSDAYMMYVHCSQSVIATIPQ